MQGELHPSTSRLGYSVRNDKIPQLSDCPICRKHALFYNQINDSFECLALECQHKIEAGTQEYKTMLLAMVDQEEHHILSGKKL